MLTLLLTKSNIVVDIFLNIYLVTDIYIEVNFSLHGDPERCAKRNRLILTEQEEVL